MQDLIPVWPVPTVQLDPLIRTRLFRIPVILNPFPLELLLAFFVFSHLLSTISNSVISNSLLFKLICRVESSRVESSRVESSRVESSRVESSRVESIRVELSSVE